MYLLFAENADGHEPGDYIGCTADAQRARRIVLESTLPGQFAEFAEPGHIISKDRVHANVKAVCAVPIEEGPNEEEKIIDVQNMAPADVLAFAGDDPNLQQLVQQWLARKQKHRAHTRSLLAKRKEVHEIVRSLKERVGDSTNLDFIVEKMLEMGFRQPPL